MSRLEWVIEALGRIRVEEPEGRKAIEEALGLLRGMKPRALAAEEIGSVVWMETLHEVNVWPFLTCMYDPGRDVWSFVDSDGIVQDFYGAEYGKTWRCWTGYPSPEARAAAGEME